MRILAGRLALVRCEAGAGTPSTAWHLAVISGHPSGWLITANGAAIGECGTSGLVRGSRRSSAQAGGAYRGQGYGSEAVTAVTEWLLSLAEVRQIRASTLIGNTASRRVLEKASVQLVACGDRGSPLPAPARARLRRALQYVHGR